MRLDAIVDEMEDVAVGGGVTVDDGDTVSDCVNVLLRDTESDGVPEIDMEGVRVGAGARVFALGVRLRVFVLVFNNTFVLLTEPLEEVDGVPPLRLAEVSFVADIEGTEGDRRGDHVIRDDETDTVAVAVGVSTWTVLLNGLNDALKDVDVDGDRVVEVEVEDDHVEVDDTEEVTEAVAVAVHVIKLLA